MSNKLNFQGAINIFNQHGFQILSTKEEFKNSRTRLKYQCLKCGYVGKRSVNEFTDGRGCVNCFRVSRVGTGSKYTYEDIVKIFADRGCILLSDKYINQNSKLKYICRCGNVDETSLKSFMKSKHCKKCGRKQAANNRRTTIEEIRMIFSEFGYQVLNGDYTYANEKIFYKCPNKHENSMTINHFKNGKRCPDCFTIKKSEIFRLDIEIVQEKFKEKGFTLLTNNYINSKQKLKFRCKCGNIHYTTLTNLRHIEGCSQCNISSKGEYEIIKHLKNNGINYIPQYSFDDCRNINPLLFDFAIFKDGELKCLIEYDGIQHFEPVDFAGKGEEWAKAKFIDIQIHDSLKNKYIDKNRIPLLRIPYWEFENIPTILDKFIHVVI